MHSNQKFQNIDVRYYPAQLKTSSNRWRIEFYAFNPFTERMERVVYRADKIKKKFNNLNFAKRELQKHCEVINYKLMAGWSPFADCSLSEIISIQEACMRFIDIKNKELREESLRSYRSYINIFIQYLESVNKSKLLSIDFTKYDSINYMDWITNFKKVGANTWNNYRNFMVTLFEWLIERGYYNTNHFSKIKPKRKTQKNRILITAEDRTRIFNHLRDTDFPFLVFLLFEFNCLMRPVEIFRMKIENINTDTQFISLEGCQTKNKNNRMIVIPDSFNALLVEYWEQYNINSYSKDMYLFSRKFLPADFLVLRKEANTKWVQLRKDLNLPADYQLYSLRDTAITSMLMSNISAKVVQKHADHHDLAITSRYCDHVTPQMNQDIKENFPNF